MRNIIHVIKGIIMPRIVYTTVTGSGDPTTHNGSTWLRRSTAVNIIVGSDGYNNVKAPGDAQSGTTCTVINATGSTAAVYGVYDGPVYINDNSARTFVFAEGTWYAGPQA
jgi:hypothetical protein